jgi:hypothetical protein
VKPLTEVYFVRMYFWQRFYNPINQKSEFNTYNYIFIALNRFVIIIICFDILHFQLLLCVVISFHDVPNRFSKWVWLSGCTPLNDEVTCESYNQSHGAFKMT